jgi:hypothetical protein
MKTYGDMILAMRPKNVLTEDNVRTLKEKKRKVQKSFKSFQNILTHSSQKLWRLDFSDAAKKRIHGGLKADKRGVFSNILKGSETVDLKTTISVIQRVGITNC